MTGRVIYRVSQKIFLLIENPKLLISADIKKKYLKILTFELLKSGRLFLGDQVDSYCLVYLIWSVAVALYFIVSRTV